MKKIGFIAAVVATLSFSAAVWAAPEGVVTTNANIGGGNARLVYVDMSSPNRQAEAKISSQMAPASAQTLINSVSDGTVVAAMNGGFFNAYYKTGSVSFPDNYPRVYGTVISNGRILNGGSINAPGLVFDKTGKPYIGNVTVSSYITVNGTREYRTSVNNIDSYCYTSDFKAPVYVPSGDYVSYIKDGVVTDVVRSEGVNVAVPENTTIVTDINLSKGDKVTLGYSASINGESIDADTVMTCGPMILHNGEVPDMSGSYDDKQAADAVNQKSFAAIAPDGRLILGKTVSSNNKIAAYLKSIGVKDAMSLDGGASSMLYVKDMGYIQNAGRNLANVFMIVDKTAPATPEPIQPSSAYISAGNQEYHLSAYNIGGNNYFKLRDLAYIFSNSSAAFNVGYDAETKVVTIDSNPGGQYSGDATGTYEASTDYSKSTSPLIVNGSEKYLDVYNIDGSNYFKIRDIADVLGINIYYDEATTAIVINI